MKLLNLEQRHSVIVCQQEMRHTVRHSAHLQTALSETSVTDKSDDDTNLCTCRAENLPYIFYIFILYILLLH